MNPSNGTFRKRGVDYPVPEEMFTLPGEYYHSEDIYQQELEKIFYRRWQLACREEQISRPGDFIVVPVGNESIIVSRTKRDEIKAHFNVCRHRGTRICMEERGHFENGVIQCPYHAWQYDLDGALKGAPLMRDVSGFKKEDHSLYPVNVRLWGGFVFINLSENPAPFEDEMGALFERFEAWRLPELRIAHHLPYRLKCNWKLILQNYQECYHCPGVHPLLADWTPFQNAVHDCMEGAVIGGYMELTTEGGSMTMDGLAAAPPVCDVSGDDLQRVYYYSVYPNLLLSPHPDFVLYHLIRPVNVGEITNDCYFLLHPEVMNDAKKMERFQSAIEFWDMTNRQDWAVCEQMQLGTSSIRFTGGRYAPQEDMLYALDKELLKALAEKK
ncbi:MAG: aromatic ring-hydroxylating dioxygenase subunit alpha [Bacteroidetes bacterium]|nr:aromatic ring-hydroxylating dioxygenase subunit alpha [Bacteroidota bacterium]